MSFLTLRLPRQLSTLPAIRYKRARELLEFWELPPYLPSLESLS